MLDIENSLKQMQARGERRTLRLTANGVDFSSNDYLGMTESVAVRTGLMTALSNEMALGATGSRLLSGNTPVHQATEEYLCALFGTEAALLFSSGYLANLAVMTALGDDGAAFFSDQRNHASLIDGMRLTSAERVVFRHNDLQHLAELLRTSRAKRKVVVTESVFSMDGDLAPLPELVALARTHEAWLVVDEAHATGVFGASGLGCLDSLVYEKLVAVHTAGKALGAQGAFVTSSAVFREWLINRARSFIYSTALAPLAVLQIRLSLECLLREPQRRLDLQARALRFRERLAQFADIGSSHSQIVPVIVGSAAQALSLAEFICARGFAVRAIRSPTVAVGQERLRLTLRSVHQESELDGLLGALKEGLYHAQA